MGREIRRVPPNWEHPLRECPHERWHGGCDFSKSHDGKCYQPLYDEDFDTAFTEWAEGYELWKQGKHPYQDDCNYWDIEGWPPDPDYYRPKWIVEPTWYQMYETVSEGTPVTPPFATKELLIDYLVKVGSFWDHGQGWSRKAAESFVKAEFAMSGIAIPGKGVFGPRDEEMYDLENNDNIELSE